MSKKTWTRVCKFARASSVRCRKNSQINNVYAPVFFFNDVLRKTLNWAEQCFDRVPLMQSISWKNVAEADRVCGRIRGLQRKDYFTVVWRGFFKPGLRASLISTV